MEKISIELTQHQIDVVFDCLTGSRSCPPSDGDLVNLFHKYSNGTGFYCSWVMYEVHLNVLGDERFIKFKLGNNFVYHLPDSDSVCELIKNLPDNILVSLREYDFDSVSDILYKLTEQ